MKTIIRLVILAAITVMPFMADAQNSKKEEDKMWEYYLSKETPPQKEITNPRWFKHLLGKPMKEIKFENDSIRWAYSRSYGEYYVNDYVLRSGDDFFEYYLEFKKVDGVYLLSQIIRFSYLHEYTKQQFFGISAPSREYYLNKAYQNTVKPQKTVWLKFWEEKIKNDIKKDLKESK